jgi:hypothetical protein
LVAKLLRRRLATLEALLLTLDPVLPINSLKLFRHLFYNLEDPDLRPDGLEFDRLSDRKLVRHVPNPSYVELDTT